MTTPKILIFGSSGIIGSEIVRILTKDGTTVRTTTSKTPQATKNGVEQVKVDILTGEGLKHAFKGIETAFFLSPGGYADQYRVLSPLIQEAKMNGVKKVVLMTAMGANADANTPLRRAEIELEKSGLAYNIIRPNWFMQNFQTFWIQGIREQGKILLPAGKAKVSFIDTRDISEVAAKLLTSNQFDNKDFDLSGSEALDHDEVARIISGSTGKNISYQEIAPAELKKGLINAGLPADYADFILLILGFLAQGYNAGITPNVQKILGKSPRSFKHYALENKQAWL